MKMARKPNINIITPNLPSARAGLELMSHSVSYQCEYVKRLKTQQVTQEDGLLQWWIQADVKTITHTNTKLKSREEFLQNFFP